jgi:hypothetical protein
LTLKPPKEIEDELIEWLKWWNACLRSVKPWVQTPISPKKKKKRHRGPLNIYWWQKLAWKGYIVHDPIVSQKSYEKMSGCQRFEDRKQRDKWGP